MLDVIIIGGGPAGLSAALYTARASLKTLVIYKDGGTLEKADRIQNYFGVPDAPSGKQLLACGFSQAKALGVQLLNAEVLSLDYDGTYTVCGNGFCHSAKAVILATGAGRASANIKGAKQFTGHGVSYCAVCDGFFFRNKRVAVLGAGEYALHEKDVLQPLAASCVLLTGGKPEPANANVPVCTKEIAEIYGTDVLQGVRFKDGTDMALDGLFIAQGVAGAGELARKVGALLNGGSVQITGGQACSMPGLFAAGDCTGGVLQVSKAVGEGAVAALSAIEYIRKVKT